MPNSASKSAAMPPGQLTFLELVAPPALAPGYAEYKDLDRDALLKLAWVSQQEIKRLRQTNIGLSIQNKAGRAYQAALEQRLILAGLMGAEAPLHSDQPELAVITKKEGE